jgi:hypothetical protein
MPAGPLAEVAGRPLRLDAVAARGLDLGAASDAMTFLLCEYGFRAASVPYSAERRHKRVQKVACPIRIGYCCLQWSKR